MVTLFNNYNSEITLTNCYKNLHSFGSLSKHMSAFLFILSKILSNIKIFLYFLNRVG